MTPCTAVVHEWVAARAGSEQVFERLAQLLPDADLFALSWTPGVDLDVGKRTVGTTFLDRRVLRDRRELTLPLMPAAWRSLSRRRDYDLVVTSHHAFAHTNRLAAPGGRHLCYVHSPARYVWSPAIDGRGAGRVIAPARRLLQGIDLRATRGVHSYAANSTAVQRRIAEYWGRDARVIYPPVQIDYFADGADEPRRRDYALAVGRWIGYKRFDLAIAAAARAGMPLVVAGSGPGESALRALADRLRHPVRFVRRPDNDQLRDLYRGATALIFPTVEDFGIVPVEAQAAGTPVIAPRAGGAVDTVSHGTTGLLVDEVTVESLATALDDVTRRRWSGFGAHVETFSVRSFSRAVTAWLAE